MTDSLFFVLLLLIGFLLLPALFWFAGWWTVTVADFLDKRFNR